MEQSKFYQIKNVAEHEYTLVGCDGSIITRPIQDVNKSASAFTIQDAKDGDVLCCESGWTCIFKTLVNDETFSSYCFMDNTKWFCETWSECHTLNKEFIKAYNGKIKPATKEQRDTLMKAMADAGYAFDFEKKELKKIVVPIFKIGDTIIKKHNSDILYFGSFTITDITGGKYWYNDRIICDITEQDDWELIEQKSSWSEEDETALDDALWCCKQAASIAKDENDMGSIWYAERWLKSFKDRATWKPSNEQMTYIQDAISKYNEFSNEYTGLVKLYNDLKKLKGE